MHVFAQAVIYVGRLSAEVLKRGYWERIQSLILWTSKYFEENDVDSFIAAQGDWVSLLRSSDMTDTDPSQTQP